MRERFCRVCKGWHDVERWPHNCLPERNMAASTLPAPRFISDGIEIRSMHDGNMYTSKSRLRSAYRAAGVEEIGNEPFRPQPRKIEKTPVRDELRRVYHQMT